MKFRIRNILIFLAILFLYTCTRILFMTFSLGIDMETLGHLSRMYRYMDFESGRIIYSSDEPYSYYNFYGITITILAGVLGLQFSIIEFLLEFRVFYHFTYILLILFMSITTYLSADRLMFDEKRQLYNPLIIAASFALTAYNFFVYYFSLSPWSFAFYLFSLLILILIKRNEKNTSNAIASFILCIILVSAMSFYHYIINNIFLLIFLISLLFVGIYCKKCCWCDNFTKLIIITILISFIVNTIYTSISSESLITLIREVYEGRFEIKEAFFTGELGPMPLIYRVSRYLNAFIYFLLLIYSLMTILKNRHSMPIPAFTLSFLYSFIAILLLLAYVPPSYWFDRVIFLAILISNITILSSLLAIFAQPQSNNMLATRKKSIISLIFIALVFTGIIYLNGYYTNDRIYKGNSFVISYISSSFILQNLEGSTTICWYRYNPPGLEMALSSAKHEILATIYDQYSIYYEGLGKYPYAMGLQFLRTLPTAIVLFIQRMPKAAYNPAQALDLREMGIIFNSLDREIILLSVRR